MHQPTQQQLETLIANFEKALEIAGRYAPVSMSETAVEFDHPCGTPHCHGGWYAIASCADMVSKTFSPDWAEGAKKIVKDLGFDCYKDLLKWAQYNPDIWGNRYGGHMFTDPDSFDLEDNNSDDGLQKIIDHWKGVKRRAAKIAG